MQREPANLEADVTKDAHASGTRERSETEAPRVDPNADETAEHHRAAAFHHESAAHHHREAARHRVARDEEEAARHAEAARSHATAAAEHEEHTERSVPSGAVADADRLHQLARSAGAQTEAPTRAAPQNKGVS